MMQISLSDRKVNPGKYVSMAQNQDIMITRNGNIVAKTVTAKPDKKAAWDNITGVFRSQEMKEVEVPQEREERILR